MNISPAVRWAALLFVAASSLHADDRVYVKFSPGHKENARAAIAQAGGNVRHEFDDLDTVAISLPTQARGALAHNPNILAVEDDPIRELLSQSTPYGIDLVQAPAAVKAGATGAGIKIGVIDSGVYAAHEDLQGVTITGEPDFGAADQRTWYRDFFSHGTHVVGTIAAAKNSVGVIGVSPGAVAIHMVKVFGDTGQWVYSSDLLAAARAAAAKGCKIISMSLGGGRPSLTEQKGLDDLYSSKGILLVAAAGNDGTTATSFPAGYTSVVSVSAIDSSKVVAGFSQKNSDVELSAPGVAVLSTVSYIDTSFVASGSKSVPAGHIEFAGRGSVSSALAYGGLGDAVNPAWSGKIVLVDRGTISFYEKVHNVELSGGIGCVLANNETATPDANFSGTLGDGNSSTIPAVSVSYNNGLALQALVGSTVTLSTTIAQPISGYDYFDGTSMATPHVSGVAALIWSKYPGATNVQIRNALDSTAEDLGAAGRDTSYGYGLIRAVNALNALGGVTPPPPPSDTTAPIITALKGTVTNAKNGSFEISWITNEKSTSEITINSSTYSDPTLVTSHVRSFRGTKGATYSFSVASTDAAGNTAVAGPQQIIIQ